MEPTIPSPTAPDLPPEGRRSRTSSLPDFLTEARRLGFLGPGEVEQHLEHARGFARALDQGAVAGRDRSADPGRVLDLGSGGGLPGLVLALEWPRSTFVLLDAGERRVEFLRRAVEGGNLAVRVAVVRGRAETVAHDPEHRGTYDVVVARSFGPPPVTAECAAGFLRVGGLLVVSEPPDPGSGDRWPAEGLAALGMSPAQEVRGRYGYHLVRQDRPCPDRYPRRVGIPVKRPLF